MPQSIEFKFSLGQRVKTEVYTAGVITMLGHDLGGNHYFVKTSVGADWYSENLVHDNEAKETNTSSEQSENDTLAAA